MQLLAGIPTYGDMIKVLDKHARSEHPQGFAQAAGAGQGTGGNGSGKQEKFPRPTGITDANWAYFDAQWKAGLCKMTAALSLTW